MRRHEFDHFQQHFPHEHPAFLARPHLSRRGLFRSAAGLAGAFLLPGLNQGVAQSLSASPKGTAKNLIFILMSGGPSQVDTFDLKMLDGVSPSELAPERINGIHWPVGLFPKLAQHLPPSPSSGPCVRGRWYMRPARNGCRSGAIRRDRKVALPPTLAASSLGRKKRSGARQMPSLPSWLWT